MYNYNKQRSRATITPKEIQNSGIRVLTRPSQGQETFINCTWNPMFGPQFSLQASATTVNERPAKQMVPGSREMSPYQRSDPSAPSPTLRKMLLAQHNDSNGQIQSAASSAGSSRPDRNPPSSASSVSTISTTTSQHLYLRDKQRHSALAFAQDVTFTDNGFHGLGSNSSASSLLGDERHDIRSLHSAGPGARIPRAPVYLPGDRVIFAESPSSPGVPVVYRTPEERAANPDRLNLDRRRLAVCPILEGEEQLRLLNYQHNLINRIEHLHGLKRLIFLDLYDNQIESISGLNALKSLRVLMLGKNRIQKIENLEPLTKLDVLDLHGNMINKVENLSHLSELRVLNLAGNNIQHVDNLSGMDALTELNLRRNRIRSVVDVDNLASLQRLFLSFNEISCFDDIACVGESHSLSEISLDGNPFSQEPHYKQTVLRHMQQLRQLDMKRISEDERRIATVMARKEEDKKRESNKVQVMKERRRLAINNARRQWDVMQGSIMARTNKLVRGAMPDLVASHVGNIPNTDLQDDEEDISSGSRPTSAKSIVSERDSLTNIRPGSHGASRGATPDKDKVIISGPVGSNSSLNVDYLAELDGDTLNLYGSGALEALDKNWGMGAAGSVTSIVFKFVDFEEISKHIHKVRARFPSVHTLSFSSTNIASLHQLNALSALRRLDNLIITPEGNPVTQFALWRSYVLFRLAHFALKKINDVEVSAADIVNAEKFFGPLAHITTSQMPQSRLVSLLGENKRKQLLALTEDKLRKPPETKMSDRTAIESVGRAGLTYLSPDSLQQKLQEQRARNDFVGSYIKELTVEAINVDKKRVALRRLWPAILEDMVHTAVIDMWDKTAYMKRCLEELEKS